MTLDADEFIRRFLLHTLPDGFHRIRHYGFLANGHRAAKLALCRRLLAAPPPGTARQTRTRMPSTRTRPSAARAAAAPWSCLAILPRPAPRRPSFWHDSS